MLEPSQTRSFTVHLRGGRDAMAIEEMSAEAAAMAYIEETHYILDEDAIAVVVRDAESGQEHCYRVSLGTGEVQPCA